jgi:hypothetical protein
MDRHEPRPGEGRLPELDPVHRAEFDRGMRELERYLARHALFAQTARAPAPVPPRRGGHRTSLRGHGKTLLLGCLLLVLSCLAYLSSLGPR